jgi:hypothetical protein
VAPTEVLDHLDAGDVLIVKRLDRLDFARSNPPATTSLFYEPD